MGRFIAVCVALFVVAASIVVLTQAQETGALSNVLSGKSFFTAIYHAYLAEPLLDEVAWLIFVTVPLVLIPVTLWYRAALAGQQKEAKMRFDEASTAAQQLAKSQVDTAAAVHHLARTDPEAAISAIQQRLTEAEQAVRTQHTRNEMPDLQSRVDYIRDQQEALKNQLAPVLEKRRLIEQLFMELDGRQNDIDRALTEIVSADDAVTLDLSLKNLTEFIKRSHGRCDDIERSSKIMANLKQDLSALEARLAPFAASEGGVQSLVKDLSKARADLATLLDSLQTTPDGTLSEQLQKFAEGHKSLESRISELDSQFSELGTIRGDVGALFQRISRALDSVSLAKSGEGVEGIDARVDELRAFIDDTQARFDDIGRRMVVFSQIRTGLGELKSKLAPLESEQGGVLSIIAELKELRDGLAGTIRRIEEGEEGSLADRVKGFAQAKRELEERVSMLSDQCFKLATTRNDIAVLLQKLGATVTAAERWSKDADGLNGTGRPGAAGGSEAAG